jgi:membrane protein CcdC involved in cytochrome C biogenesis
MGHVTASICGVIFVSLLVFRLIVNYISPLIYHTGSGEVFFVFNNGHIIPYKDMILFL